MSSRREVLIRILALLQRKTLIETKNRTLKCLKWHYSTVRSMKNFAVLTEDGAFALFFRPHPRGIWQLKSTHPREFAILGKKNANARGSARGGGEGGRGRSWNWLMHNPAVSCTTCYTSSCYIQSCNSVKVSNWKRFTIWSKLDTPETD